jgi:hypothetical protein
VRPGAVLLRETDRRLNLLPRLAACFEDHRQPWLISHPVTEMAAQRVYGLALAYEDLSDHDQSREDPLKVRSVAIARLAYEAVDSGLLQANNPAERTEVLSRILPPACADRRTAC